MYICIYTYKEHLPRICLAKEDQGKKTEDVIVPCLSCGTAKADTNNHTGATTTTTTFANKAMHTHTSGSRGWWQQRRRRGGGQEVGKLKVQY